MDNKWSKYDWLGLIGTIVFHGIIIAFLLIAGFTTPLPLPEEKGVMVNLGYSDQGMGNVQPTQPQQSSSSQSSSSSQKQEKTSQEQEQTSPNQEDVVTQDREPAPEMDKKSEDQQSEQQKNKNKDTDTEKSKETESEDKKSEEKNINKDALYNGSGNSQGGNEGQTGEAGDQGHPDGDPDANNYKGTPGGGGKGVNFSLSGRYAQELPKPKYKSQEQGKVVVKIWVDQQGNVIRAEPQLKGSTTTDKKLQQIAKKAAMRASFSSRKKAPEIQTGTITYNFILQE